MPAKRKDPDDQPELSLDASEPSDSAASTEAADPAASEGSTPEDPSHADPSAETEGADISPEETPKTSLIVPVGKVTPRVLNHVGEMYGNWFLDYASYVILERAVPHIDDGIKPVQRRVLHAMERIDDGRFNKVANIIGDTMKYHPHGNMAIKDAIVWLGQRDLLIDTQGNWGNLLTGDDAAAERYIEARLSKFALDVMYNARITQWSASYDGRNKEPVTFPAKFPVLLVQGVEGIAVGLSCKILPHNFNEVCDAAIEALRGKPVNLLPDFITGGIMDATEYNEGRRGGRVRVRARIDKPAKQKNILRILEIPFGTTTAGVMDSILAANDKGKLKIAKVEDLTADKVEIVIHLPAGVDQDDALKALYVFTDCEVSIAPNCVVIQDNKPVFISVNDLLRHSAERTKEMLRQELEIKLDDLEAKWHFSSLEKIFIEKRIYRDIEECTTWDAVMAAIWKGLKPYLKNLRREVTDEDVAKLTEIRIKRISKYNSFEADELLLGLEKEIEELKGYLAQLTKYAISWFKQLQKKYGTGRDRRTEITTFAAVQAKAAAIATENLYVNWDDGYIGYGMKRTGENIGKCSRLDDVIVFLEDGTMKVSRVSERAFFGEKLKYVAIFNKEEPVWYNMIYRDGPRGKVYAKRFQVGGVTRDTVYDLTKGTKGSRVWWLSVHTSQEKSDAEKVTVHLSGDKLRKTEIDFTFGSMEVKARGAQGNLVTDHTVKRVSRG